MTARAAVFVLLGVAHAASAHAAPPAAVFEDISATPDGGAWLLVRTRGVTTELRRIDSLGEVTTVATPRLVEAIAAAPDGTVWGVSADSVLHRSETGAWTSVALAAPTGTLAAWYGTTGQVLAPLAHDRLLVLRGCATGNDCSEAYVVDAAAATAGDVTTFDWVVGPAVPDGRGGAWALMHRGFGVDEKSGYAHLGDAGWESWTFQGLPVAGMTDRGKTTAEPRVIAVGRGGGFVGATDHELVEIGPDGQPFRTVSNDPKESFTNRALGLARVGDRYATVFGMTYADSENTHDTSPVISFVGFAVGRTVQKERASTPSWWRRANQASTPVMRVSGGGVSLWVMTGELLMYKARGAWQELPANPENPRGSDRADSPIAALLSLPIDLGIGQTEALAGAGGSSTGFAVGFRPEVVFTPNYRQPRFGVGVYGEVAHQPGITPIGGGATIVAYAGLLGAAASVGVDRVQGNPQLVLSGFIGIRARLPDLPLDMPLGLRVDVRPGTDRVPGSVMVSASLDVVAATIIAAVLAGSLVRH